MNLVSNFYQTEEPLRRLIRYLAANPGATALDIACKKGDTSQSLAEHVGKLVALDKELFSQEWREHGKFLRFVNGDALALPFGNERFDTVVACECLQYLEKPLSAIDEIYRVLKPGGTLIMSFPEGYAAYFLNPYNLASRIKSWMGGKRSQNATPVRAQKILEACAERWQRDVFARRGTLLFIYAAFMIEKLQVLRVLAKNRRRFWLCLLILDPLIKGLFILMKVDFSLPLSFMSYNNVIRLKKTPGRS